MSRLEGLPSAAVNVALRSGVTLEQLELALYASARHRRAALLASLPGFRRALHAAGWSDGDISRWRRTAALPTRLRGVS